MASTTITIEVDEELAKEFAALSEEDRRKMVLLLRLRLRDLVA